LPCLFEGGANNGVVQNRFRRQWHGRFHWRLLLEFYALWSGTLLVSAAQSSNSAVGKKGSLFANLAECIGPEDRPFDHLANQYNTAPASVKPLVKSQNVFRMIVCGLVAMERPHALTIPIRTKGRMCFGGASSSSSGSHRCLVHCQPSRPIWRPLRAVGNEHRTRQHHIGMKRLIQWTQLSSMRGE